MRPAPLTPAYRDMNAFSYTLAMIYESLRLRDLVMTLPKLVAEDVIIPYTTWDALGNITERTRLIRKGSHIIIDSPACQRNPRYWENPSKFDPTRHLGQAGATKGPGYTGFSMGVRQCIGKRFAEVEMVSLVVNLVRRFKLLPVPLEGETFEQLQKRYEKGNEELSFTPDNWDIRLERR
jgi:cytochrome P450